MIPEEYLVVEARIARELDNIRQLEEELSGYKLFPRIATSAVGGFALTDSAVCSITGSILHDYYVAVENVFKVVAGRIDRTVPSGEYWHQEILEQMTLEVPGVRPPRGGARNGEKTGPVEGLPARVPERLRVQPVA